jgi:hypothetical protein
VPEGAGVKIAVDVKVAFVVVTLTGPAAVPGITKSTALVELAEIIMGARPPMLADFIDVRSKFEDVTVIKVPAGPEAGVKVSIGFELAMIVQDNFAVPTKPFASVDATVRT